VPIYQRLSRAGSHRKMRDAARSGLREYRWTQKAPDDAGAFELLI
jgi:hypothetical protein